MSKIRLVSSGIPDLLPMQNRSPGVHVSDIIWYICLKSGLYKEEFELDKSRMALGKALEWAIIQQYLEHDRLHGKYNLVNLGELQLDGISGTPDIGWVEDEAIEEVKLTWRSSRGVDSGGVDRGETKVGEIAHEDHPIYGDKFRANWWQVKSYCKMIGWNKGLLNLTHVRGDYKEFKVVQNVWEAEWNDKELEDHWTMIRRNRDRMDREKG